jgi:hypothetical protein
MFPCAITSSFCNTSFKSLVSSRPNRSEITPWVVVDLSSLGGKAADPILKRETTESLFVGVLNEDGVKNLNLVVGPLSPTGVSSQWSNAFAVAMDDWPNRRRKGSGYCTFSGLKLLEPLLTWSLMHLMFDLGSGMAGTSFFIDPTTGIAAVYGTQLICSSLGTFEPEFVKGFAAFEEALYSGIA